MYPEIKNTLKKASAINIPEERKPVLHRLIEFCQSQLDEGLPLNLNFICTHNSRRSQFSQVWAKVAATHFSIEANCFSGGVEVTAFHPNAIASLQRVGFSIAADTSENPKYQLTFGDVHEPITAFSKLFDDAINPTSDFAAVMTCSDADENCPFIPGTKARIPLNYEDPKAFDNTPKQDAKYDERSLQIASEMLYVFGKV